MADFQPLPPLWVSLATKHSFCHLLPPKVWRQNRSVNHWRGLKCKCAKMDAVGIFEAIKKSPFSGVNFHFRPLSADASAEFMADACHSIDGYKLYDFIKQALWLNFES